MRSSRKRKILVGIVATLLVLGVLVPLAIWRSLTYEPPFYRELTSMDRAIRRVEADHFVSQTFQLRNDIANEGHWEASFTDEEVNAWLAEHLVSHFRDDIPEGVSEPVVVFDLDRVTLAFKLDQGPFTSLVWVVAELRVAGDNTIALSLEKIRAGAFPVPAEEIAARITRQARLNGLQIDWRQERGESVAYIRYSPTPGRVDVVLERLSILDGRIFIGGRSDRAAGRFSGLELPDRRVLQMNFPARSDPTGHRDRRSNPSS